MPSGIRRGDDSADTRSSQSGAAPKLLRRVELSSLTAKDANHSPHESTEMAESVSSSDLGDICGLVKL